MAGIGPMKNMVSKHIYYGLPYSVPVPEFTDPEWVCLYPIYIEADRTVSGGRRLPRHLCRSNVHAQDIAEVCSLVCKLPSILEPFKAHPRESTIKTGRVRVQLRKNGELVNPAYPNKTAILRKCCEILPSLESRACRIRLLDAEQAKLDSYIAEILPGMDSGTKSSASGGKKKKKGKR